MPLKLVHTSDVHLDCTFAALADRKGRDKRAAVRAVFRRIIDDCLEWPADALLIAGDLYESRRVSPDTIGFLKSEFARLGDIPALIAPGNHDPFTDRSPYAAASWSDNVHIFQSGEMEVIDLPELPLRVAGLAHTSHHVQGRLTDVARRREDTDVPTVLLAHASLQGQGIAEKSESDIWLPFTEAELADLSYTFAALGHYHNPREISADGRALGAYPGAPEGLNFSEQGRRSYARVTLEEGAVSIERVPVSRIDYQVMRISCDNFQTRAQLFDAIATSAPRDAESTILRVEAVGRTAPGFQLTGRVGEELAGRFFHIDVVDSTSPGYDWEALAEENSLRGEVVRRFAQAVEGAGPGERERMEKARLYALEALEGRAIELPEEVLRAD